MQTTQKFRTNNALHQVYKAVHPLLLTLIIIFIAITMASRIAIAALFLQALVLVHHHATAAHLPQGVADVLNFALNLECLEAQFYSCAVYGKLAFIHEIPALFWMSRCHAHRLNAFSLLPRI